MKTDSEAHFRRFPVVLVSFALIWLGALAPLGHLWLSSQSLPYWPVAPHIALVSLLCGSALLTVRSKARVSRLLALASLAICIVMAAQGIGASGSSWLLPTGLALDTQSGRMLLVGLLSLAIFCSSLGPACRRMARIMAVMVILASIYFRLAAIWLPAMLYEQANAINQETLLDILAASAAFAVSRQSATARVFKHHGLAAIAMAGAFVAVLAWYAVIGQNHITSHQFAQSVTTRVEDSLRREVNDQIALIDRMARRWNALDTMPSERLINEELLSYLGHINTLEYMAVIDPARKISWMQGGDSQMLSWLDRYLSLADVDKWLDQAHRNHQTQIRSLTSTESSIPRALIAAPLSNTAMKGWTILAIQNVPMLTAKALGPALGQIQFRILDEDRVLYDDVARSGRIFHISSSSVPLHDDLSWVLSSWRVQPWTQPATLLPDLILLVCLAFTYGMIGLRKQASQLLHGSRQLQHSALHQTLTGLPNKAYLEIELARICRSPNSYPVWLAIFEMDGVKLINDTLGHSVGDQVTQQAAQRIRAEAGNEGFVAQIESSEFIVAMHNVSRAAAVDLIDRILLQCASSYHIENMELRLTASAGITSRHTDTDSPMDLVSEADLALGLAKRTAPGSWREYSADLGAAVAERLQLRNDLQHALDINALTLHYQPLIQRDTGKIVGIEALVRWNHPALGFIPPSKFIPLAEDTGQIIPLTAWVLDQACRAISVLRERKLADFHVAVNISPLVFERNDFIETVTAALSRHGLPTHSIELEITEGTMLGDQTLTINKLKALNALGILSSIDDFGTGYSSLNYLKTLPIGKVKIDKSFVNELNSDSDDAAIVKTIISLAHHLNLKVVAEGVETVTQYQFLLDNACDEFQGYLFSRPLPFKELVRRLMAGQGLPPFSQSVPRRLA
ncbi:MAG: bifunctional diguanylate cyclase/phosphodiesterase [Pusillimonas sp.]